MLGNNVKVQNNVSIYTGVMLEDDVFCGPSMVFTNVVNPRSHVVRKHEYRRTLVRRGASLGANCTVVCGHDIGRFAFIGAGRGGHEGRARLRAGRRQPGPHRRLDVRVRHQAERRRRAAGGGDLRVVRHGLPRRQPAA